MIGQDPRAQEEDKNLRAARTLYNRVMGELGLPADVVPGLEQRAYIQFTDIISQCRARDPQGSAQTRESAKADARAWLLREYSAGLREEGDRLRAWYKTLDERRSQVDRDREALSTERERLDALRTKYEQREVDQAETEAAIKRAQETLGRLSAELLEKERKIAAEEERIKNEREQLETSDRELKGKYTDFEGQLKAYEQKAAALAQREGSIADREREVQERDVTYQGMVDDFQRREEEQKRRKEQLDGAAEAATRAHSRLTTREEDLKTQADAVRKQAEELAAREREVSAAKGDAEEKAISMEQGLFALGDRQRVLDTREEALTKAAAELKLWREKLEQTERELAEQRKRAAGMGPEGPEIVAARAGVRLTDVPEYVSGLFKENPALVDVVLARLREKDPAAYKLLVARVEAAEKKRTDGDTPEFELIAPDEPERTKERVSL